MGGAGVSGGAGSVGGVGLTGSVGGVGSPGLLGGVGSVSDGVLVMVVLAFATSPSVLVPDTVAANEPAFSNV